MGTSIFLAKLLGPVMLVIGVAVLANRQGFRTIAEEFLASRALMFLGGLIIMPAGVAIVLTHNVWTTDWRVLVTLFGWLLAIAGAIRIVEPPFLLAGARIFLHRRAALAVAGAIWTFIGLLFCLFGYLR